MRNNKFLNVTNKETKKSHVAPLLKSIYYKYRAINLYLDRAAFSVSTILINKIQISRRLSYFKCLSGNFLIWSNHLWRKVFDKFEYKLVQASHYFFRKNFMKMSGEVAPFYQKLSEFT